MKKLLTRHMYILLALAAIGCEQKPMPFTYLSGDQTGISFENKVRNTEAINILNYLYFYNGAGVAAADFNADGRTDLYFTANDGADRLYRNEGNMKFSDITALAGIDNATPWTTGVAAADIDGNGFPDLYICKVSPLSPEGTHNLLFLNDGPDANGIPQFREAAATVGLDFSGYSTQAAFFDQDADGDLDMFLLNHSVHPNRNYGRGSLRDLTDSLSGDRFYRNHNGHFINESEAAGIHTGKIGYGLGISVGDINNDGYPDIYVGNDFFENDYLYLNRGDGTFEDINLSAEALGHTSHFSMGNDIGDIDNDFLPDIISADMLPEDLETYKTSGTEYPYQIYRNYLRNGYREQYMQNTLHLNAGNGLFKETAYLSGIAATEWSWSPLMGDLDNDGLRDVFITNGIPGATNDMDFVNFIANEEIQKKLGSDMSPEALEFIERLPEKKTRNYIFKNKGHRIFAKAEVWNNHPPSFSNGAVLADLDNDNDLDLVVNNLNEPAFIIRNDNSGGNALKVGFKGATKNTEGIGARALVYAGDGIQALAENYPQRGYLSSQPTSLHFGLGTSSQIDSVRVWWPDNHTELKTGIAPNTLLVFEHKDAVPFQERPGKSKADILTVKTPGLQPEFVHRDQPSLEFNIDPLIPYASTNLGPRVTVGDLNNDGREDLVLGGGKTQPAAAYLQTREGAFRKAEIPLLEEDALPEYTDQLVFDANGDGLNDILLVAGGNEFLAGDPLRPRLYLQTSGGFILSETAFSDISLNASRVKAADIDGDGDNDLLLAANINPRNFGETPEQYLMENNGQGHFKDITDTFAPGLRTIGNVQDIVWKDLDMNGTPDLILAGHWMPVAIFTNTGSGLQLKENNGLSQTHGLWNTIEVADMDGDGDLDIIAGNWGKNTRLQASEEQPMRLYRKDMDDNGSTETIVTFYYQGTETPFASKDELSKQMPFLNKKYLSYKEFSQATMADLFGTENLSTAILKEVYELASCYFENDGNGRYLKKELPFDAQTSYISDMTIADLNADGYPDLILTGNLKEVSTQLGRQDSNRGTLLLNDTKGGFCEAGNATLSGPMTSIAPITVNGQIQWIVTRNNDTPLFLQPTNQKTHEDPNE